MHDPTEHYSADYLYVRCSDTSGVLHLSDEEKPGSSWQTVDLAMARRAVWETYSERILSRSRSVREQLGDVTPGIRPQVVEDLLLWIYREEGFPVLLASEIACQIQALVDTRSTTRIEITLSKRFPVSSLLLTRELVRLFPHLEGATRKETPAGRLSELLCHLALPLARACTWIILLGARLQGERPVPNIEQWPDEIFAVYPGWATHSRHVWKYMAQRHQENGDEIVFVLGNALRRVRPHIPSQVDVDNVQFVRPLRRRDLPSCYAALKHSWPTASGLVTCVLNDVSTGLHTRSLWQLKAAYSLLNAHMIETYVKWLQPKSKVTAVFGIIASPIDTALDLALQHQNLTTVHWLHGIVAYGLQYRAHSTFCLCRSSLEREVRTAFGAYDTCLSAAPNQKDYIAYKPRNDKTGLLLLTNLIHLESPLPREDEAERDLHVLLEWTAQVAHTIQERPTWRPHPRERANRRHFPKAARIAERLSYIIDGTTNLSTQLSTQRYVVCTFSTTIADAVQAGVVPAIYAGTPQEQVGYWAALPEALKFRNGGELLQVINRLSNPAFAQATHRHLAKLFNGATQQLPASGFFAHFAQHDSEKQYGSDSPPPQFGVAGTTL